ncbi:Imm74 family immunity protein [Listeria kieliensis]
MKKWEPPHESEKLTDEEKEAIITEVLNNVSESTVQIMFD